ncbi:MAG: YrdB family protein [Anaerolineae bacterium]|nr:YrdB family protein [Anaerolineae bacterium]
MDLLKAVNLAVTFFLELAMLAALGYWGFSASDSLPLQLLLGLGAPLVAILIWARFMAPKSPSHLTGAPYLVLKTMLFGAAALGLIAAGQPAWALAFVIVALINQALLILWRQ